MKIAYLTNGLPSYRSDFIDKILKSKELNITIFYHKTVYGYHFKECQVYDQTKVKPCKTVGLFSGSIIISKIPFFKILKNYDIIISDGNPRHVSFAIVSTIGSIIGKRVIIWSTYHSRRNFWLTQMIRKTWWRCFSEFLSYTEGDAKTLSAIFPKTKCYSANNGINQSNIQILRGQIDSQLRFNHLEKYALTKKKVAVSIGRIIPGRFELMVQALPEIVKAVPDFVWVLIGGGVGEDFIKQELRKSGLEDRAILVGALFREEDIASWFSIAQIFVYPDAIGLSLHHAFGYELPVVIHDQAVLHGPEVDIFFNNQNGRVFKRGDPESLADVVCQLINDPSECLRMGKFGREIVTNQYNSEVMFQRFTKFILNKSEKWVTM